MWWWVYAIFPLILLAGMLYIGDAGLKEMLSGQVGGLFFVGVVAYFVLPVILARRD